jgi:hypothetical protein
MNHNWSFEDREWTMEEFKDFFFKTFYHWTYAFELMVDIIIYRSSHDVVLVYN